MDFPGGSITNIRVIDGFSNIYWRIYTEEQNATNTLADAPNNGHTILKHISRLKELELRLRSLGCLVLSYPRRLGLLIFSATSEFEHLLPLLANEGRDEPNRLLIGSTILKVWTSGSVTAGDLVKSLCPESQTPGVNSSTGSQRLQNGSMPPRRVDTSGGSAAIYASFISAVTAAFSLQLIRQNNAIPLGPRTLYNAVECDLYEGLDIVNNDPTSVSVLTTLQAQLTSVGKLTITLQTIAQTGLTRLSQPRDPLELSDVSPGTDLWLAPNGSIARLVTLSPVAGNTPNSLANSEGIGHDRASTKRWKSNALEWLSYFGLPVDCVEEENWVEVEVWEPFYAKLSGEAARPNEENPRIPLKRLLWPAIYCFRRTKSSISEPCDMMEGISPFACDPLEFAEKWCFTEIPKAILEPSVKLVPDHQDRQTNDQGTLSPGLPGFPDGIESLSRASLYPELQTASLVYPTPPDGAAGTGPSHPVSSDVFVEDLDHGSSFALNQTKPRLDSQPITRNRSDPDVTMGFGPSAGLVVGSGLYDTNGDDDLFGDMNERDFGTKGITDEDFSFFDEPGFENMGNNPPDDDIDGISDFVDPIKPEDIAHPEPDAPQSHEPPVEETYVRQPSPDEQKPLLPCEQPVPHDTAALPSPHDEQVQTISPPLSPVEVKKFLFPEPDAHDETSVKTGQPPSFYSPIKFKQNLSSWDQKYGAEGKFWFMSSGASRIKDSPSLSGDIPTVGLPRGRGRLNHAGIYLKARDAQGSPSSEMVQESPSSLGSSSETGDDSDDSGAENIMSPAVLSARKRKRARSNSGTSLALSSEKPPTTVDQDMSTPRTDDSVFLGNFLSTFADWSMTGFFSSTENQVFPVLTSRETQVQVAQLFVDQVTQSSLDHKLDGNFGVSCLQNQPFFLRGLLEGTEFLGGVEKLDLNGFVTLQETNSLSPPASNGPVVARQTPQRRDAGKGLIVKLSPPHLRVRRGKDFLETLPPAVSFWETFGLEPAHGPKNISAYCIHPNIAGKAADAFLERLGVIYSSCNLGNHARGDKSDAFEQGLRAWDVTSSGQSGYHSVMQHLKAICEELGTALLNGPPSKDNIVVYIINPFLHAASLVDICFAFWSLFRRYIADADKQQTKQFDELVLQVIPMSFVASPESLVVPPQPEYLSLALEVYSRCPPKPVQSSLLSCAPPVLIAEPLPGSIGFRLVSERSSPLQEGKCLHIACSRSQDQRWVSVAWSDNTGALQRSMSYCVRFRNSIAPRTIFTVRNEIWAATIDIMEKNQARWRVIIVSTENVDQDEHDTWLNFADQYNKIKSVPIELTVLSVNTTPDLFLSSPLPQIPMSIFNQHPSATPVTTPNPGIFSPDQLGNAPTPPGAGNFPANASTPTDALLEAEGESMLTDICDESWGIVLSHRLNSTLHLTEYRPALVSGYLLRRKGTSDSDGAFAMNVNLLYTQRPSSANETLLREILGMYRDLATLARARGTRIVQSSTLPWHIATAVRAQEILSYVL
ncbi:hypothetical protein ARAM_004123 [Aspergillus rambellii]|uniref:Mediator of RNA polymerase II transcription subunit 13 n=1 Tax=Aspergillus rambellii TaxID=308745 RepID=A0A0F8UPR6_9EURO|nr:hypothetical protein ARAM_004123 [Aspergillus rambellii]